MLPSSFPGNIPNSRDDLMPEILKVAFIPTPTLLLPEITGVGSTVIFFEVWKFQPVVQTAT